MRKDLVVSIADLRYVSIGCAHCPTKVILDMKEKSLLAEKHGFFAPPKCPGCTAEYDSAIQAAVDGLQRSYQSLLKFGDRITFRASAAEEAEG